MKNELNKNVIDYLKNRLIVLTNNNEIIKVFVILYFKAYVTERSETKYEMILFDIKKTMEEQRYFNNTQLQTLKDTNTLIIHPKVYYELL